MKQNKAIALLTLTSLALAALPATMVVAQVASASVRLSASRGQVEFLGSNGRWERLRGPLQASVGTAVRTAPGAELVATFNDGSTVTLGETSAMKFTRLAQTDHADVSVRLMGQMTASLSPLRVQRDSLTVDMPVARATINQAFATARAVRQDVASSLAHVSLQTPTGRAVRMAVTQGAATLQPLYNVVGVVTSTDAAHGTFTVIENNTGRARRIVVGQATLLAAHETNTARATRTPQQIVEALSARTSVIVYGDPVTAEGPGDPGDPGTVAANIVYPEGNDFVSAEQFVTQDGAPPILPATAGTAYTPPPVGDGIAIVAGNTGEVVAGSLAVTTAAGVGLVAVTSEVAPAAGSVGAVALPVIAGVAVITAIGISTQAANSGHTTNNTSTESDTGTLQVTVNRVHNRARLGPTANVAAPMQTGASFGANILASSSAFRASGPTISTVGGDNPGLVGRWPLGPYFQLHVGAAMDRSDMFSNAMQMDYGVDYQINKNQTLGAGVRTTSYNVLDPLGNASSMNTSLTELRYSVRY